MNQKVKNYIKQLGLVRHPEGGYFREVYRSGELILQKHLPKRYKSTRNFSTSIYFLLEGKQFSSFHKLKSDELWHFYDGSTVIVYIIDKKGILSIQKLGKEKECIFQLTIRKEHWFAAEVEDKKSFSLFGCTVSPGFDFEDFELGGGMMLIKKFPQHEEIIRRLTTQKKY